jgi:hypothetical protein
MSRGQCGSGHLNLGKEVGLVLWVARWSCGWNRRLLHQPSSSILDSGPADPMVDRIKPNLDGIKSVTFLLLSRILSVAKIK